MSYTVYKHTFPNNKVYIGITSKSITRRWRNGEGYRNKQQLIYRAINKYGWDNIKHEMLFTGLTKEQAEQKEIELIKLYNSTDSQYGYNAESGGNVNKTLSESTREKIRLANVGKRHSEDTKRKMSESQKGKRHLSNEQLKKMRAGRNYNFTVWNKGKCVDTKVPVIQYDKCGNKIKEYINVHVAQEETGIQHIYDVCKGKRKSAGGFIWKYATN
jgi:group I intron endonuclease